MIYRIIVGDIYLIIKAIFFWRIHFNLFSLFSGTIDKDHRSFISISKKDNIMKGAVLTAHAGGALLIAPNVYIGRNTMIVARSKIEIGEGTNIGMNVVIIDHDHDYKNKSDSLLCSDIKIGKNVWIGASCVILRGTIIGDNCVIAAGSLIKGNFPANSLVLNKRDTVITTIERTRL